MTAPTHSPRTQRDFRAVIDSLPPHLTGQVIAGRLVVLPRPAMPHSLTLGALDKLIGTPFQYGMGGPGGWWIVPEPELSLGIDLDFDPVVPDLVGWRRARVPSLPATASCSIVADWVCEVLSPSTEVDDRAEKAPFYARAGIEHLWLVDPVAHVVETFRRQGAQYQLLATYREADVMRAEPFEAVSIDLSLVWLT